MELEKNWNGNYYVEFSELKGKTLTEITGKIGDETMTFTSDEGSIYQLHYYEDCCASCNVEDICGDLEDLLNTPILSAEEVSSKDPSLELQAIRNKEKEEAEKDGGYYWGHESETWTFYKLSTIKGSVTLRWYGSSNGYYSESATFERIK